MKVGQLVYVCHDGKLGRRRDGVVIAVKPHEIHVSFFHPTADSDKDLLVDAWFKREPASRRSRGKKRSYDGWVDIDWFAPWFSVYDKKLADKQLNRPQTHCRKWYHKYDGIITGADFDEMEYIRSFI